MSANDWLAQELADMHDLPVERPELVETTALGAAMLAAVGAGLFPDLAAAGAAMGGARRGFLPDMDARIREERLARWRVALAAV